MSESNDSILGRWRARVAARHEEAAAAKAKIVADRVHKKMMRVRLDSAKVTIARLTGLLEERGL